MPESRLSAINTQHLSSFTCRHNSLCRFQGSCQAQVSGLYLPVRMSLSCVMQAYGA